MHERYRTAFDHLAGALDPILESGDLGSTVVLFRHSIRPPIPKDPELRDVPLTQAGHDLARQLGERARHWPIRHVISSPMRRCVDTARAFVGVRAEADPDEIERDTMLGDPGPFVADAEAAWTPYVELGKFELVRRLATGELTGPAFHPIPSAARRFASFLFDAGSPEREGLTLAYSHDIVMSLVLSRVWGEPLPARAWPDYHEALILHVGSTQRSIIYRGAHHPLPDSWSPSNPRV